MITPVVHNPVVGCVINCNSVSLQGEMDEHVKTIAMLDDQITDPVALDQLVTVASLQAIDEVVEPVLDQARTRPIGSLAVEIDGDGAPTSIRWVVSTWSGGLLGKFETKKLFPGAETVEPKSRWTTLWFEGSSFAFRPDSWTSCLLYTSPSPRD